MEKDADQPRELPFNSNFSERKSPYMQQYHAVTLQIV